MSNVTLYGIPNCNSVKKALDWLDANKIKYTFHNYKKEGISYEKLQQWCKEISWELIFNTKGTTWKKIAPLYQNKKLTQKEAIAIMLENTSIIKRPIIEFKNGIIVGYNEDSLSASFINQH